MTHRLLAALCAFALLVSLFALPASAEEVEMDFTMHLDMPPEFEDADYYDFEEFADADGHYTNLITEGGVYFEYAYLKMEAYNPHLTVEFEVETAGTYEFLLELMAFSTQIPRTGLVQIDGGRLHYIRSLHGDRHLVPEYYTGLSAELEPGVHELTIYLADDFDDVTVKSLFFDCFYLINRTALDADAMATENDTEPPTAAPTEAPTETPTEAPTAIPTEPLTEAPTAAPTTEAPEAPADGCSATVAASALLLLAAAAALRRRR